MMKLSPNVVIYLVVVCMQVNLSSGCKVVFFGENCAQQCHCKGEPCNNLTGICPSGICEPGYRGDTCSEQESNSQPTGSASVGPIAGSIVGAMAFAVVVIVVVIFLRKRRQNSSPINKTCLPGRKKTRNDVNNGAQEEADVENTSTTPGIYIHDLWEYISRNKANKGVGFGVEFKKLKDGLIFPHNDALANRKKNRYKEMFPYDHSRVHLKVDYNGESEFINASHIKGIDGTPKFIASQGPIKVMVDDFWRMVWQQNSTIIVMLTNLIEAGNQKCMNYWPDKGSVKYARITITMIQEKDVSDYCVRTLEIQQDGEAPRRIRQFHFKAWPDKDVPDSTWSLAKFWRDIFRDRNMDNGPIVVHCSAGVGRTGTFIALDNLYHQAVTEGMVKPLSVVATLRDQRVKMVQTSNQFMFLHEALADLLLFGTHYIWLSQFPDYYDFMIKRDKAIGKVRLRVQYEYLEKSLGRAEFGDGSLTAAANTVREIDEYRPKSATSMDRESEELCTVFLPGLNGPNSFILTTLPGDRSIIECWQQIDDYNIKTVITLTDEGNGSNESIWAFINDKVYGTYNHVLAVDKQTGSLRERHFKYTCTRQIKAKANKSETNFKQIEVNFSCKSGAETQADTILKLVDLVSSWHPYISTREPVMIQCRDGVSDSGVLSVLLNEKQRILKEGGQINILESVMMARRANKSCISSFSQYKFIHDIMIEAVEKKEPVSAHEEIINLSIQNQ